MRIGETARAILHKTVDDGVSDFEMAKEIRLDLIEPDPEQPRKHFDEGALQELSQSIRVQGVLQPIVVEWVAERERFRIISGERRWRATRMAAEAQAAEGEPSTISGGASRRDLSRIPAIIKNPRAIDRYVQQVYENEQRQDYSDVERALAYERLKGILDVTWDGLAAKLGLSRQRIHQIRSTKNRLAESVRDDITQRKITERQARKLVLLPPVAQEVVADAIKGQNLTQQQTDAVVQRVRRAIATAPVEPAPGDLTEQSASEVVVTERAKSVDTHQQTEERKPWFTSVVAGAIKEVVQGEADQHNGAIPTASQTEGEIKRFLGWTAQRRQFEALVPIGPTERQSLLTALDELIDWAELQRQRLASKT